MTFQIVRLSPQLVYIRWHNSPMVGSDDEKKYIAKLTHLLDTTETPVYFLSDLRQGRIVNVSILRQLGQLALRDEWAGSAAFSQNSISSVFVGVFSQFARQEKPSDEMWATPEEALAHLACMETGIVEGIDWQAVLDLDSDPTQFDMNQQSPPEPNPDGDT